MEKILLASIFLFLAGGFLFLGRHTARAQKPAHFFAGIPVLLAAIPGSIWLCIEWNRILSIHQK